MRPLLLILAMVALLGLVGCPKLRGPTREEIERDGSLGAAIAALLASPAAAPVGAALAVAIGVVIRSFEKGKIKERHAEEKIELTDQFARRLEGIATTQTFRASEALTKNTDQEV